MQYPIYFYRYIGSRLFYLVALCILTGFLDGLGLTMFLPLLQLADGKKDIAGTDMGNMKPLFEFINNNGIVLTLGSVLLFLCIFFILKGAIVYIGNAYRISVQQLFVKKIRMQMLNSLSSLLYKKFITSDVGRIQNTMSGEVARLSMALNSYLMALQNYVLVTVYICFAVLTNIQFSTLVILGGGLIHFVFRRIYTITKRISSTVTRESHVYQGLLIQFIASFKYLKATGTMSKIGDKLQNQISNIEKNNRKIGMLSAIVSSVREPSMIIVVAAAIFFQVYFWGGSLSTILVSLLFFYRALSSLMTVQIQWNSFLTVSGSMDNMRNFQGDLDAGKETKGNVALVEFKHHIDLSNVGLIYDSKQILYDISLRINKNETIAFVGESGSGKTSLVNVIAGLLPVDQGDMKIDGVNSETIDIETYQKRIGYITQEAVIFNTSIYNNVTLWAESTPENMQRFRDAVEKASITSFINELAAKEETEIGNNGINLSGGQRQRISIARELFKPLDILIMDEATSALDSETERAIQNNIDVLKGSYTMLIVAHRLSTIKNADRIVFMKKGRIESIGSYHQLIEKEAAFKRMVELQELY